MNRFRALTLVCALALSATAIPLYSAFAAPASVEVSTVETPIAVATPAAEPSDELAQLAEKESATPALEEFRGGSSTVVISEGAVVLVLVIVIIIIIL
jgi:hypothetical protein